MSKIFLFAMLSAVDAHAGAYFKIMRPLDEIKSGAFIALGTPNDNVSYGAQTTIIKHRAQDGYLLIPGVGWSLLDVGAAKSERGEVSAVVGPSVDLSEPVKAIALRGLNAIWPTSVGSLKALFTPTEAGHASLAASVGPGWALNTRTWKGAVVIHAGLAAKW